MAFRPSTPELVPSADGKTFGIRGWKVFSSGYWKGELFTAERIRRLLATYRYLKSIIPNFAPKVRLGHDTKQRLAASLGLPNAGRVVDVRADGDGFSIDIDGIPITVLASDGRGGFLAFNIEDAIRNGNYDGGSVEIKTRMRDPNNATRELADVFDGISLLGEEQPAVKTTESPGFHLYSADGARRLAFSDFTEDPPMPPEAAQVPPPAAVPPVAGAPGAPPDKKQQLADAMGMDVNDPAIQALTPEQVDAFLDQMGSQKFSDCMKKKFADGPMNGVTPPPGADDSNAPVTQQQYSDLKKQLYAAEAAAADAKSVAAGTASNGMVTMSEAHRRIDECVTKGKLTKVLADVKKEDAKTLLTLPSAQLCFSDGAHKGRAKIAEFLAELEARPADIMLSEQINDSAKPKGAAGIDPELRRKMETSREGRAELLWLDGRAA